MPDIQSTTLDENRFMQAFGNAVSLAGAIAVAVNPTANDVARVMRIPAGTRVDAIMLANPDMDTGGTALVFSMGYVPVVAADGPTAAPAYFQAAGDTTLTAVNAGKVYCNFAPITFDSDVYLTLTFGAAATTFAAGTIRARVIGEARGTK